MKLPAHRAGLPGHASGEQNVSKGNFVHIVPLDPAYKAGLAGHVPVKEGVDSSPVRCGDSSTSGSAGFSGHLLLPFSSKDSSKKTTNFRSPIGNALSILPFTLSIDFNSGRVFLVTTMISPVLSLTL